MTVRDLRTTGAGCVCIAVDEQNQPCMLLGREKETHGWRDGSNRWSSFSGRVEAGEDALRGAAREFLEESLCLVSFGTRDASTVSLVEDIIASEAAGTVEHVVQGRRALCRNIVYIVRVPFDRTLPERFRRLRADLEALEAAASRYSKMRKEAEHAPGICLPGATPSPFLVVARSVLTGRHCEIMLWDSVAQASCVETLQLDERQCNEVARLLVAWESTMDQVKRAAPDVLNHPAVQTLYANSEMVAASVNRVYLEKNEIAWWRLSDLAEICGNRAGPKAERFRSYFLDILPHILELLKTGLRDCASSLAWRSCQPGRLSEGAAGARSGRVEEAIAKSPRIRGARAPGSQVRCRSHALTPAQCRPP